MSSFHLTARHGAAAYALARAPARADPLESIVGGHMALIEKEYRSPAASN